MKKFIFLLLFCSCMIDLSAQSEKKNQIGTHFAVGFGGYGPIRLEGAPSYHTKYYYSIGLDYSRQIAKHWDICSGLEYTYNNMTASPPPYPMRERPSWPANLTLVTVPVQLKYHIGKMFYINSGIFLNIIANERMEAWGFGDSGWYSLDKENKNSVAMLLGFGIGIGLEHQFPSGLTLSLNPQARFNGIGNKISLQSDAMSNYKYLQAGASFGVGYKF